VDLTQEQREKVNSWAAEGAGLSEIQSRIAEEFGIRMSYMETRLMILELGTQIKDKEEPAKKEKKKEDLQADPGTGDQEVDSGMEDREGDDIGGSVSVSVSPLARPGFAMTGEVIFSDGVKAEWGLTNDGRFALDPEQEGYRPSDEDLASFQLELRNELSKRGF
jgi:hypothetical protein